MLPVAELYDPTVGTFTVTGSLNNTRDGSTATLLNDGTVLVAGGYNPGQPFVYLAAAEVFDPAAGTFTITGSMAAARAYLTATLLGGGAVLVVAGEDTLSLGCPQGCLSSAELYLEVGLSPGSVSFSNQTTGTTSAAQTVTVTNNLSAALTIAGVSIQGANASNFAQTNTCGSSLAAGAKCSIDVTFSPTTVGALTANVAIANNAIPSPIPVAFSGTGVAPAPVVSLSSTTVAFGNQTVGITSAPQTVTLTNTGTASLKIQTVALAGGNTSNFAIASGSTCTNGATIAINGTCTVAITFTPNAVNSLIQDTVLITDNAADSPEGISLSGAGTPVPTVTVTPSKVTFPNAQFVGTSGNPQSVTLTNTGQAPLAISGVTASPSDFAVLNSCGNSLAAGGSCAIGVFFDPTVGGTRTGTLTINDNASGSPQTVALSGVGQDFSLAASGGSSSTISPGQTANFTLAMAPAGGFNQTVTFSCSGAPAQGSCSVSPNTAVPSAPGSTNVIVTVATAAGTVPWFAPISGDGYRPYLLTLEMLALALMAGMLALRQTGRPRWATGLAVLVVLSCAGLMAACGGGSSTGGGGGGGGTPAGTYTIVVSGSYASGATKLTHSTNFTLVVQ
jgi:hypothetical protein